MPRLVRPRIIDAPLSQSLCFKPCRCIPRGITVLTLKVEELEALRLSDIDGAGQAEAARQMGISRHTFGRILASARRKTAEALVKGYALEVSGGNHAWRQPSEQIIKENQHMKIAISAEGPTLNDQVDPKFGRAAGFLIYDTASKQTEWHNNGAAQTSAQGAGLLAAQLVADAGAQVVLSGYVGPKAFEALQTAGIRIVQDMDNRTVAEAIADFEAGDADVLVS